MRLLILSFLIGLWGSLSSASPEFWQNEWPKTDFSTNAIASWTEILSGGPGKDGIPALSDPRFQLIADESSLGPMEPVMTLSLNGERPRAYPVRYLMWHEIVNDQVGDIPVSVTFCPLCNAGIVFDRRVDGQVLSFGVTGKLRNSDLVMYDHQSESWWQQATGQGIVGAMTGKTLTTLPSWMESWQSFTNAHPDGLVMMEPTSHRRPYGSNPYVRYDSATRPFLYNGEMPPHDISPLERVVHVGTRAWPLTRLQAAGEIREADLVITWRAGQASALDAADIGAGADVGNIRVKDANGQDVVHDIIFAFVFQAFWPDGTWMIAD